MEQNFVINIGRQLGGGGMAVGKRLARRLGVPLYDKELIDLAARESGLCATLFERADEREAKGLFATLVGYLRAPFAGYEGGNSNNVLSHEALFKIQSDVIRDLAARQSCIFVGRCADYILRDHPRALSLFLTADEEDRVERLCRAHGWTADEALSRIRRTDACRADYYNYYSARTWGEAATYDLCLNTSRLGVERSVDFVLSFAAARLNLNIPTL
ncbi:MAG: cytidylate kinase-like family protein [Alistipes sp.]|nr:cytidylate kinase-like family protein [Alistipes sp.]